MKLIAFLVFTVSIACNQNTSLKGTDITLAGGDSVVVSVKNSSGKAEIKKVKKVIKSEEEWKKQLNDGEFFVLRKKGTERAFTGEYWENHEAGIYKCRGCGLELFESETKFESGTGWPSFWAPIAKENVTIGSDNSHGMSRDEVTCTQCGGHLGHVFDDGPRPTGLRYCMNSISMLFEKK